MGNREPLLTIGRGPGADLRIRGGSVAERHALVSRVDARSFEILDVSGKGAISINGIQAPRGLVRAGDRLVLGDVTVPPARILALLAGGGPILARLRVAAARLRWPILAFVLAAAGAAAAFTAWCAMDARSRPGAFAPHDVSAPLLPDAVDADSPAAEAPESSATPLVLVVPPEAAPSPRLVEPSSDPSDRETTALRLALGEVTADPGDGLRVRLRVENQQGRPLTGLGRGSFLLRRRAGERFVLPPDEVGVAEAVSQGRSLFLVLDVSRSMYRGDRLLRARGLVGEIADRLDSGDRAALVRCADAPDLVMPLGAPVALTAAMDGLRLGNRTALWDCIAAAVSLARHVPNGRLIVLTDGGDTISSRGPEEVTKEAVEAGVPVAVVGFQLQPRYRPDLDRLVRSTGMGRVVPALLEDPGPGDVDRLLAGPPDAGSPWYELRWSPGSLEGGTEDPVLLIRYGAASGIREDVLPIP